MPRDPYVRDSARELARAHMNDPEGVLVISSSWTEIPPPVLGRLADISISWLDLVIPQDETAQALLYTAPVDALKGERIHILNTADDRIYKIGVDNLGRIRWGRPDMTISDLLTTMVMDKYL